MENNQIINYIKEEDQVLYTNYNCDCGCGKKIDFPYIYYRCYDNVYHYFNWYCWKYQSTEYYCIKKNCINNIPFTSSLINNSIMYIDTEYYKYAVNKYYDKYIWVYCSNISNNYWLYSKDNSKFLEEKYNIMMANKYTVDGREVKKTFKELTFLSDDVIDNILHYLNLCKDCLKGGNNTIINCCCNDTKCKKNRCNMNCNILNKVNISCNDDTLNINIKSKTQISKSNKNKRFIQRLSKADILNNIDKVNGIGGMQIKK